MRSVRGVLLLLVLMALAPAARADDLGVTPVTLREGSDGTTELLVRAPARLARFLAAPRLSDGTPFQSEGFVPVGGAGALRFLLRDRALTHDDVIHFPWSRQAILLDATLADGSRARTIVRRAGSSIDVGMADLRPDRRTVWARARAAVLGGIEHATHGLTHLLFLVVIGLLMLGRRGLRHAAMLLCGHLVGLVVTHALGWVPAAPTGVLALGAATAVLGMCAFTRAAPAGLPFVTLFGGVLHAAALDVGLGVGVGIVLGMDAVLILVVAAVSAFARRPRETQAARAWGAAMAGGLALALVLLWAFERPVVRVLDPALVEAGTGPLPALPGGGAGGGAAGSAATRTSAPLAPPASQAPLQAYLVVEPFEVRVEILARLASVAPWLDGVDAGQVVAVAEQPAVKTELAALAASLLAVQINGAEARPADTRVDFVTVGPTGTLPRVEDVAEAVDDARVGIVLTFLTEGVADDVALRWLRFEPVARDVVIAITDPEKTRAARLMPDAPSATWRNDLVADPIPSIEAVRVDPVRMPVPWLALPLFAVVGVLLWRWLRGRGTAWTLAAARVVLVVALLVAPSGETAVALPFVDRPAPNVERAKTLVGRLLTNVYSAFVFRREEDVYDRLAQSVAGDQLSQIYLENRRALEVAERGGAQARVEAVDVEAADELTATDEGFTVLCEWTVAGSVSHFGHRHYRQNRYRARLTIRADGDRWTIVAIEILEQRRVL